VFKIFDVLVTEAVSAVTIEADPCSPSVVSVARIVVVVVAIVELSPVDNVRYTAVVRSRMVEFNIGGIVLGSVDVGSDELVTLAVDEASVVYNFDVDGSKLPSCVEGSSAFLPIKTSTMNTKY